jgi:hypothetical protein
MKLPTAAFATALLATGSATAKECRLVVEALPGVRAPATPGCPPADRATKPAPAERFQAGRDPGFFDLGGGTTVRVGGRVRAETAFGR